MYIVVSYREDRGRYYVHLNDDGSLYIAESVKDAKKVIKKEDLENDDPELVVFDPFDPNEKEV